MFVKLIIFCYFTCSLNRIYVCIILSLKEFYGEAVSLINQCCQLYGLSISFIVRQILKIIIFTIIWTRFLVFIAIILIALSTSLLFFYVLKILRHCYVCYHNFRAITFFEKYSITSRYKIQGRRKDDNQVD